MQLPWFFPFSALSFTASVEADKATGGLVSDIAGRIHATGVLRQFPTPSQATIDAMLAKSLADSEEVDAMYAKRLMPR